MRLDRKLANKSLHCASKFGGERSLRRQPAGQRCHSCCLWCAYGYAALVGCPIQRDIMIGHGPLRDFSSRERDVVGGSLGGS